MPQISLPDQPANGLTAGIDWARDDHAVAIVDARGKQIARQTVEHSDAGLCGLLDLFAKYGVAEVAIERPDGPVVDTLLDGGLTVVVISPNQVKNLRGRYGSAGNKDDRFDAFVLADTLRTDRARLRPLTPDSPATVALRHACRARKDLVAHRVGLANQLREHLRRVFPGAVGLFADIDSQISLSISGPLRLPRPRRLALAQTARCLAGQCRLQRQNRSQPYCTPALRPPHGAPSATTAMPKPTSPGRFWPCWSSLTEQIKALSVQIDEQLALHADPHIFTSLPRAGRVRAARLLAEIGDCRARFPTPESLACLAGVAPSTRQSGKIRSVGFRWACDKQLRDAVTDFAGDTRQANLWAADLYERALARGHDHPHAVRILARAWLYVIWHCWQDNTAYDPDRHRALQRLIQSRNQAAA